MRFSPGAKYRARSGIYLAALAVGLALSVALVTPTNGLVDTSAHQLLPVHSIFSHDHDPDGGRDPDDASTAHAALGGAPLFAPVGPFGAGLGLSVEGLLATSPLAVLGPLFMWPLVARPFRLAQQAWVPVPTGPPR